MRQTGRLAAHVRVETTTMQTTMTAVAMHRVGGATTMMIGAVDEMTMMMIVATPIDAAETTETGTETGIETGTETAAAAKTGATSHGADTMMTATTMTGVTETGAATIDADGVVLHRRR